MKKLLILALALSSNAWAEFKSLDCSRGDLEGFFTRITFDPELADAEKWDRYEDEKFGKTYETYPVKVKVFPSYYRFVWSEMDGARVDILTLNRKDLTYARQRTFSEIPAMNNEHTGTCELVETGTENIL